jgi:hypothetical protein
VHDGRDAHTCDDETGLEAAALKWMSDRESYVIAKLICTFFFCRGVITHVLRPSIHSDAVASRLASVPCVSVCQCIGQRSCSFTQE